MMKIKNKLSLSRPSIYQIKVPGELDESWFEWGGEMAVTVGTDDDGFRVTTLTGIFDQAALLGLLRRLYSMGLPLISVLCVEIL
jgi:hypothetical protein